MDRNLISWKILTVFENGVVSAERTTITRLVEVFNRLRNERKPASIGDMSSLAAEYAVRRSGGKKIKRIIIEGES